MRTSSVSHYKPDPFELQIGAMVILHRATLLPHDQATHNNLIEASNDYLRYGQQLERLSGQPPPWNPKSDNEVTPAEVFLETAEWIGTTQAIPNPSLGMDHRHFRLTLRDEVEKGKFGPTPELSQSLAVVELVQHPDKRWQVLHAEVSPVYRRRGIATMLYDRIQTALGATLAPSGWLSDDAYLFWQNRGSHVLQWYRQVDHFPGLWISPKVMTCNLGRACKRATY